VAIALGIEIERDSAATGSSREDGVDYMAKSRAYDHHRVRYFRELTRDEAFGFSNGING
jgi:hypothetical protein